MGLLAIVLVVLVAFVVLSGARKAYHWDNAGWTRGKVFLIGGVVLALVLWSCSRAHGAAF